MTKIFFYATLALIITSHAGLNAQKTRSTLVFKDGTTKTGFGKLGGSDKVLFKAERKGQTFKYTFNELDKAIIHDDDTPSTYKYVKIDQNKHKVLKELNVGKVSLFTLLTTGYSGGMYMPNGAGGGGMMVGPGSFYDIKNLYVRREGEETATHLGSNQLFTKNFKKAASAFFGDCPTLVTKIENRDYTKRDIQEIVQFYNNECSVETANNN